MKITHLVYPFFTAGFELWSIYSTLRTIWILKKLTVSLPEDKELKKQRKKFIQVLLKDRLSLSVDVVKQESGTTNTGNVARCFLANAEIVSEVSGLNKELIQCFHNIMQTLLSGKMIDCGKFESYCIDTEKIIIKHYSCYKIPPSVHKLLTHGSKIIKTFNVPFGWLSEEPQEANNKVFRKARSNNSRMSNRKATNEDIMHHLFIGSDPLISSLRLKDTKCKTPLSDQAENLLL